MARVVFRLRSLSRDSWKGQQYEYDGCFTGSYAVMNGVSQAMPTDLHIKGCPPRPFDLLSGLLALLKQPE